ncbi:hypothetical protein HYX13_04175 [Candidatus Woesearchaeota archaeon]|nr:hypothetical protein [Candidatus Woesearchaeota archaeon]
MIQQLRPYIAAVGLYLGACAPAIQQQVTAEPTSQSQLDNFSLEERAMKELQITTRSLLEFRKVDGKKYIFRNKSTVLLLSGVCAGNGKMEVQGNQVYVTSSFSEKEEGSEHKDYVVATADKLGDNNQVVTFNELRNLGIQILMANGKCQ